jgi:hypothetical protein
VPFGLYNEINDIDVARVPILLPQSIYPTTSRDFLLAQTGAELYSLLRLGSAGNLDLRAYGGTVFAAIEDTPGSPYELAGARWPYVVGGRALWEAPVEGLRLGGSLQALKLETDILITDQMIVPDPMTMMSRVVSVPRRETLTLSGVLWVASIEYAPGDLLLAAEYSRWHLDLEVSEPMLAPDETETISERMFAMIAYRVTPWFQPGLYYALHFPSVDDRDGRDAKQHDTALTARFDINPYWLFKLEGHFMHGTAALSPGLNDSTPRTELPRNWALLLAKTTAYF